jgi:GNAT superfamily N-acetyltransferase
MTSSADTDLYDRGIRTLLACWEENARGASGAALVRSPGVAAAVFPSEPERSVYNNAVPDRGMSARERVAALEATEAAYASVGIARFAVWVHESDEGMHHELSARGYSFNESTRAMGMSLDDLQFAPGAIELGPPEWSEYLRVLGMPGLLRDADPAVFHVLVARLDGDSVATALAFDSAGDCGIFNVSTLESARRRGLATTLTALHLRDAVARGCRTATLQSTPTAERVYRRLGFRDLGQILEYTP